MPNWTYRTSAQWNARESEGGFCGRRHQTAQLFSVCTPCPGPCPGPGPSPGPSPGPGCRNWNVWKTKQPESVDDKVAKQTWLIFCFEKNKIVFISHSTKHRSLCYGLLWAFAVLKLKMTVKWRRACFMQTTRCVIAHLFCCCKKENFILCL